MRDYISGVYHIKSIKSGKYYIGSAKHIPHRWSEHTRLLNAQKHHSPKLQNAWNRYGSENFEFLVIELCELDQLLVREQHWLEHRQCFRYGYNMTRQAGSRRGTKQPPLTEEQRRKMIAGLTGKKRSEETKAKLHVALQKANAARLKKYGPSGPCKGRKPSPESIEKMRASKKGKPLSPEHKEKLRSVLIRANAARWNDPAQREKAKRKMSAWASIPEIRQSTSERMKASWKDPEQKAKMVEGIKASWVTRKAN